MKRYRPMPLVKITPSFNRNRLAMFLGRKDFGELSYSTNKKVGKWAARLKDLLVPRLYFQSLPITHVGNGFVEIEKKVSFQSLKLSRTMNGCTDMICFAATIGKRIENEISCLMKKKHLSDAFILDAMGSISVESIVEQFWKDLRSKHEENGRAASIRFSPGYCDWPVKEQRKLFRFIDTDQVRISINDHCLMSPRKSISGVFGISDPQNAQSVSMYNPCDTCKRSSCPARRK